MTIESAAATAACHERVESTPAQSSNRRTEAIAAASGAYFTSNLLLVLAGLISMPIMTRLLTKADYGLLSVSFATVSVLAVVGGCGFGEAAVRLYGEHKAGGTLALRRLCDSLLGGTLTLGLLAGLGLALFAGMDTGAPPEYQRCLFLASALIVVRVISGILYQIYRAQERAVALAATQVSVRYATTAVTITLLLLYQTRASTVLLATLIVETVTDLIRFVDLRRLGTVSRPRLAPSLLAAAARYGVPLAIGGAARFLLDWGDRFVIGHLLDLDAVATYSVAYDVAERLAESLLGPLQLAVVPILFRMWVEDGPDQTIRVASRIFNYMIALSLPAAVLYWVLNDDLIVLVASEKYRASSALTPFLLPGIILGSVNFIACIGLTIQKRTTVVAMNVCAAAAVNLCLNLLLVPRYGLTGAAAATTLAFTALVGVHLALSRPVLPLHLDWRIIRTALIASATMLLLVTCIGRHTGSPTQNIIVRGAVGIGAAGLCFSLLDRRLWRWARTGQWPAEDSRG